MKVEAECAPCLLHRGYMGVKEATNDSHERIKVTTALIGLLAQEFKPTVSPAYLATKRDRLIREMTGNADPYARIKQMSNRRALEILPEAKNLVSRSSSSKFRFRRACLCTIVGNVMEFDILNYTFKFEELNGLIQRAEEDLTVDEISQIYEMAKKAKAVLYLTDNAGEIALDTLLIDELRRLGSYVTVAVKGKPVLNDATIEDARSVGMHEVADQIITTGTDTIGLILEECSEEFRTVYGSADLVVAKGMGHAETLTELNIKSPHVLLLRTKCNPVASFFSVKKGQNVAKLIVGTENEA